MHRLIARTRPVFSLTLLACVLTLTACIDESCGITNPSEATGSHEESSSDGGRSVFVQISYVAENNGPRSLTIVSSKGGSVRVTSDQVASFLLGNMRKGDVVAFAIVEADRGDLATCTWTGKTGTLFFDVGISATVVTNRLGQLDYGLDCVGW
jgi:hypothetical protein